MADEYAEVTTVTSRACPPADPTTATLRRAAPDASSCRCCSRSSPLYCSPPAPEPTPTRTRAVRSRPHDRPRQRLRLRPAPVSDRLADTEYGRRDDRSRHPLVRVRRRDGDGQLDQGSREIPVRSPQRGRGIRPRDPGLHRSRGGAQHSPAVRFDPRPKTQRTWSAAIERLDEGSREVLASAPEGTTFQSPAEAGQALRGWTTFDEGLKSLKKTGARLDRTFGLKPPSDPWEEG